MCSKCLDKETTSLKEEVEVKTKGRWWEAIRRYTRVVCVHKDGGRPYLGEARQWGDTDLCRSEPEGGGRLIKRTLLQAGPIPLSKPSLCKILDL
jgi:hypothetical protein